MVRNTCVFKVSVGNEIGRVAISVVTDQNIVPFATVELIVSSATDKRILVFDRKQLNIVERGTNIVGTSNFNKSQRVCAIT